MPIFAKSLKMGEIYLNIPMEVLLSDDKLLEKAIQNNVIYIHSQIQHINLSAEHPFLQQNIEKSAELRDLAWLLLVLSDNVFLERFIQKLHQTRDFEKYHQLWCEVSILKYLRMSLFRNNTDLCSIEFDKKLSTHHNKDVDYSIKIKEFTKAINVEIKRITCEPAEKEDTLKGNLFIKKLFKDVNLASLVNPAELSKYIILSNSTHYQELKNEIKKINEKYHMIRDRNNSLNIGIINIDYATSLEEFVSYFCNSQKGLFVQDKRIFKNFDAIVLYYNNPSPKMDMSKNTLTFIISNISEAEKQALNNLGLGNIIYEHSSVSENWRPYAEELYTTIKLFESHGIISYYRTDIADDKIEKYHEELSRMGLHVCNHF